VKKNRLQEERKRVRKEINRLKRIESLLREIEKCGEDDDGAAFILRDRVSSLEREVKAIEDFRDISDALGSITEEYRQLADQAFQRAKNSVASSLEKKLSERGFDLSGNYPTLTCGLLTLEFSFQEKGKVTIFFGPRIEKLKQVAIDADSIADAVFDIYETLDGTGFDEDTHLDLLYRAYRNAILLRGEDAGSGIPISEVMFQTAILLQGRKFTNDPVRSAFTSYGRVRFAYDLSRIRKRITAEHELHLTVASMEQTRKPETHLWVPQSPRQTRGTHFSTLAFRRVAT
jgi:hypothetical protein